MAEAEDLLGSALGQDVRVRRAGDGVKAELSFDDLAELESLAKRLRRRSAASRRPRGQPIADRGRLAQSVRALL